MTEKLCSWFRIHHTYRRETKLRKDFQCDCSVTVWQSVIDGMMVISITRLDPFYDIQIRFEPTTLEDALNKADQHLIDMDIPFISRKFEVMI